MSFSSYKFIFYFLPIVLVVFRIFSSFKFITLCKLWLIASSLYFYYSFQTSNWFLIYFILIIVFNYAIGTLLLTIKNKSIKKLLLAVGLLENIGVLFYYKYTNFFINLINKYLSREVSFLEILLPIGISFFTFRLISYIVDCYKNKASKYNLIDYLVFITYFPALIMGPIVRHNELIPQLLKTETFRFNFESFKKAFVIFSVGLGKKIIIVTPLLEYTNMVFDLKNNPTPIGLWVGMAANLFAFYYDFSAYSDMALGISLFFNITIVENFKSPYKARNIQEYWRRWHISLTKFLSDYVFVLFYKPGNSVVLFCVGTMITFVISGFWHGAGTNFILWGFLHGLCISVIAILAIHSKRKYLLKSKFLARTITMVILLFAASLYACDGLRSYYHLVKVLFNYQYYTALGLSGSIKNIALVVTENFYHMIILVVSLLIAFYSKNINELTKQLNSKPWLFILAGILFVISIFSLGTTSQFLYQNF